MDPATPAHPGDDAPAAPTLAEDPTTVIRSEEQLQVSTRTVATSKVRLVKRIVTENVMITVPVSREEVTIERVPITDANRGDAEDGVELTEHTWELVLWAEKIGVTKTAVPVERIRLGKTIVTEDHDVTDTVRKEQLAVDQTPASGGTVDDQRLR